jgi:ADP-heptose:LPS heptosyltransferase
MQIIKKLRELNRKRNYLKKAIRYKCNLYYACVRWKRKSAKALSSGNIKSVILLRNEGKIGDAIISTWFIRALHNAGFIIDVLATKENELIFKHNPFVGGLYLSDAVNPTTSKDKFNHFVSEELLAVLRGKKYDLMIDTGLLDTGLFMPRLISEVSPKIALGFNKRPWLKHYDKSIDFDYFKRHVKLIYSDILAFLNIFPSEKPRYEIYYPHSVNQDVMDAGLIAASGKNIVVNIFASHGDRCLSQHQLAELIAGLQTMSSDCNIIVLDHKRELDRNNFSKVTLYHSPSLYHSVAVISLADIVISPDTSIVHMAAAFDKTLIAVYQNREELNELWSPGYSKAIRLFSSTYRVHEDDLLISRILKCMVTRLAD